MYISACIFKNGILTGRLPEGFDCHHPVPNSLPEGMLTMKEMSKSNDPVMRSLVNEWMKEESTSEAFGEDGDNIEVRLFVNSLLLFWFSKIIYTSYLIVNKGYS